MRGWMTVALVLSSAIPQMVGAQTLDGRWTGSYRIDNTWRFFTVELKEGGKPLGLLFVPADEESLVVTRVERDGNTVRFRSQAPGEITDFTGRLDGNHLSGDLKLPNGSGSFELIRSQPPSPELWSDYPGQYSTSGADYLGVYRYDPGNGEPHLVALDSRSGEWGILVPVQADDFALLPARAVPFSNRTRVQFDRQDGAVARVKLTRDTAADSGRRDAALHSEDVRFSNGAVELAGTLLTPSTPSASVPAVVIVHGSGAQTRDGSPSSPAYLRLVGEHLARNGYAVLLYDKRGTGQSTGDWRTASFDDLAQDVTAAIGFLKGRPGIDAQRIGLWGISEAGWVISSVVAKSGDVAFAIVVGGGGLSPAEQEVYRRQLNMQQAELSEPETGRAIAHQKKKFDLVRANDKPGLDRENESAKDEPWYRFVSNPTTEEGSWSYWRSVIDYNPSANWARYKKPLLLIFGENDESGPARPALEKIQSARAKAGVKKTDNKVFSGADHMLVVRAGNTPAHLATGYLKLMSDWLKKNAPIAANAAR